MLYFQAAITILAPELDPAEDEPVLGRLQPGNGNPGEEGVPEAMEPDGKRPHISLITGRKRFLLLLRRIHLRSLYRQLCPRCHCCGRPPSPTPTPTSRRRRIGRDPRGCRRSRVPSRSQVQRPPPAEGGELEAAEPGDGGPAELPGAAETQPDGAEGTV